MNPKATLLFALIFARMSLDFSSQYVSISLFDVTISLSQALGIAIALVGAALIASERKRLRSFPLAVSFGIILFWGLFSLSYSIAPQTTAQDLLRVFGLFSVGFLAFISTENLRNFRSVVTVLFAASILPVALGIAQFFLGIGFSDENVSAPRIFGTFAHPNVYSLFLFSIVATTILFLAIYARFPKSRAIGWIFLGCSSLALLLTFSRVAWVALFVFLVLLALWRVRVLLLPLLLAPIVLLTFSEPVRDRVAETFDPTPDSSIVWRQTLWVDTIRMAHIDGRQWLGTGLETFPKVSENLRGIRFGSNEAHNDFVKFFIEGGYVGLAAFVLYLLSILSIITLSYRRATDTRLKTVFGFLGILFFAMILSMTTDNIFKNTPLWWVFFALLGAALGALRRERMTRDK
ncbi:MAG: O-antigen ligase family protein [Candidatus Moranbacteria bacterium]|nr:O-antigen ligase family protein [Candidatus Moranbacteria bacterium]